MYIQQIVLSTLLFINLSLAIEYNQAWLRGEGPEAHPHEGIKLSDGSGWVAIGDTLHEEFLNHRTQVMVRAVDNEAGAIWVKYSRSMHENLKVTKFDAGEISVKYSRSMYGNFKSNQM